MKRSRTTVDDDGDGDQRPQANGRDSHLDEVPPLKKRRLNPPPPTIIDNLPNEIVERILYFAVLASVASLHLAKQAWKHKSNQLTADLGTVCCRWSNIISADFFQTMVHRALESTAEKTIRLEIINQMAFPRSAYNMTALADEIFVLNGPCGNGYDVGIYDRNNMPQEKMTVSIAVDVVWAFETCSLTNSIYILAEESSEQSAKHAVLQLQMNNNQDFELSSFITGLSLIQPQMTVTADHSIVISSGPHEPDLHLVYLYDTNGSLKQTTPFTETNVGCSHVQRVLLNRRGSFVIVSHAEEPTRIKVTELEPTSGQLLHENLTNIMTPAEAYFIDNDDRLIISDETGGFELLDSELNRIQNVSHLPQLTSFTYPSRVRYNYERSEIVRMPENLFEDPNEQMAIYRFVEQ